MTNAESSDRPAGHRPAREGGKGIDPAAAAAAEALAALDRPTHSTGWVECNGYLLCQGTGCKSSDDVTESHCKSCGVATWKHA